MDAAYRKLRREMQNVDPDHDADSLHTAIVEQGLDAITHSPALLKIRARSRAIDERRIRKRHNEKSSSLHVKNIEDRELTPEELAIQQELWQHVRKAVASLTHKYRQVIWLYFFGALTLNEIAERLGQSYRTVQSQLSRAKLALRNDPQLQAWRN